MFIQISLVELRKALKLSMLESPGEDIISVHITRATHCWGPLLWGGVGIILPLNEQLSLFVTTKQQVVIDIFQFINWWLSKLAVLSSFTSSTHEVSWNFLSYRKCKSLYIERDNWSAIIYQKTISFSFNMFCAAVLFSKVCLCYLHGIRAIVILGQC